MVQLVIKYPLLSLVSRQFYANFAKTQLIGRKIGFIQTHAKVTTTTTEKWKKPEKTKEKRKTRNKETISSSYEYPTQ